MKIKRQIRFGDEITAKYKKSKSEQIICHYRNQQSLSKSTKILDYLISSGSGASTDSRECLVSSFQTEKVQEILEKESSAIGPSTVRRIARHFRSAQQRRQHQKGRQRRKKQKE